MASSAELAPYIKYIDMPYSLSRKTHRLQEFYRFLDFQCPVHQQNHIVDKKLWKIFIRYNRGQFWISEKNIKRNFSELGASNLRDRVLARDQLDTYPTSKGYHVEQKNKQSPEERQKNVPPPEQFNKFQKTLTQPWARSGIDTV